MSPFENGPSNSRETFTVHFKRNKSINQFEIFDKPEEDISQSPYPFPSVAKSIGFNGCSESITFVSGCITMNIKEWITSRLDSITLESLKQEKIILLLTFGKDGKLKKYDFRAKSEEVKLSLEKVLAQFPKVKPARRYDKAIEFTYPISLILE